MKRIFAIIVLLVSRTGLAQPEREPEIVPPEWEWVVPLTSPPLFQREGEVAPTEQPFWRTLYPLMLADQYAEAMRLYQQSYAVTLRDMEAERVHGPVTDSDDMSSALFYLLGYTYGKLGQPRAAETAYLSALQYLPDYIRVHESLGYLYIDEERYTEAQVHLSRAAELGLNTASLFGSLGFLNQSTGNPWGAVSGYQQAMMLDGENEQWQRGLLNALNQSRNYGSALALVDELLAKDENDADLWVFRAYLAQRTDDDEAALASLETAIRLGHDSVSNLQVCATLHMQIGSVERAVDLLERGFVDGMDYIFVDQALTWLIRENEWDSAEELVGAARSRLPNLSDIQRSRFLTREAGIAVHDGRSSDARSSLEEALELDPSNADALMDLAALHQRAGNYGQSELLYQRATAFESYREGALLSLAQLAIDQNAYDRALDLLRQIVERNPLRVDVRRNIEILENLVQLRGGV